MLQGLERSLAFVVVPEVEPAVPLQQPLEARVGAGTTKDPADFIGQVRRGCIDKPEDQRSAELEVILVRRQSDVLGSVLESAQRARLGAIGRLNFR